MTPLDTSTTSKIRGRHLDRLAIVYVRQSTPQQVVGHRESADLQYQLRRRASDLGWPPARIEVIDDDQGLSGQAIDNRPGFQRLLAEVSLGRVGIVFGREVSRLSRSNKDWHQLLELCALFQVLIGDADGIYDPTDYNDRLLLGLRGMMSEAEIHVLRTRLHHGKLNKARRGELFTCVPGGYVRSCSTGIAFDPDEQVRSVLSLVFTKFAELGSVPKVNAHFAAHGIRLGVRTYKGSDKGRLQWRPATRRALYEILRHPFYAGAYVYGRCPVDPLAKVSGRAKSGRRSAPPEEWVCLLKDRVPAYISWEQYEQNQERLRENDRGRGASRSASGRAPTLLNGRLTCGRCGRPMGARNARPGVIARYACDHLRLERRGPMCQSVSAAAVDKLIEELIFRAVQPASLELSLRAAEQSERDRERLHDHWKQKQERAAYEANLAARRYEAVDPENRLVARELERQWEQRLTELRHLEDDYARFCTEQPRQLTAQDRERIAGLAEDLPGLWQARTTTAADRRAVVRQLIDRVVLTRRGLGEQIEVLVRWRGGTESRHEVQQGLRRYDQLSAYEGLRARVTTLRGEGQTGEQIAAALNAEGYRAPRGGSFTGDRVRRLFLLFGLTGVPAGVRGSEGLPGKHEWWLPALAAELGVKPIVVHRWRWSGWVHARQLPGENGRWIIWADGEERRRLCRLRSYEIQNRGREAPSHLREPKRRPSAKPEGVHETTPVRSDVK
jgi:DNA invertase Pin-like site-specific DNA recombinase